MDAINYSNVPACGLRIDLNKEKTRIRRRGLDKQGRGNEYQHTINTKNEWRNKRGGFSLHRMGQLVTQAV